MKAPAIIGVVLLFGAGSTVPVSANWFSNPNLGINRNIGSAPNPTPEQLRQGRLAEDELFAHDRAMRAQNYYSSPTSRSGWYYRPYQQQRTDLDSQAYAQASKPVTVYGPSWQF